LSPFFLSSKATVVQIVITTYTIAKTVHPFIFLLLVYYSSTLIHYGNLSKIWTHPPNMYLFFLKIDTSRNEKSPHFWELQLSS
jgi:hypothetical protein